MSSETGHASIVAWRRVAPEAARAAHRANDEKLIVPLTVMTLELDLADERSTALRERDADRVFARCAWLGIPLERVALLRDPASERN